MTGKPQPPERREGSPEGEVFEFAASPGGPRFQVGQIVHHRLFEYRGVVVDVHPRFQRSADWYDRVANTKPPKDRPWYEVLVHGSDRTTYVAERNLEHDLSGLPIEHPLLRMYFTEFSRGRYRVGGPVN